MSSFAFIFNTIISCLISLILLYRCSNLRRQHPITTVSVFISWFFSIVTIFILPLDISLTAYRDCLSIKANSTSDCPKPWSYTDPDVYRTFWNIIFWTSQILTWLVLPFMQGFCDTGEFSIKGKIIYSIKSNLIFYGTFLLIFIVLLIYVAINHSLNSSNFVATIVAASTTWGLFLLVLLLGYGLVQIPLLVYNQSKLLRSLSHKQFEISKLYDEKIDADENLDSLIDDLIKMCLQIRDPDPLKANLEKILKIVPDQYRNRINLTMEDFESNRIATNYLNNTLTEKDLTRLNERLKKAIHVHHRVQVLWKRKLNEGFYLEDIVTNTEKPNREFVRYNPHSTTFLRRKIFDGHPKIEWYAFCILRPWILRFLAIILSIVSVSFIWSEMTFFSTQPVLSILAQINNSASSRYHYFTIEILSCLSIGYLCLCAYYTIFRIRVLNYFYLSLYHLTDENSLLFAAMFLCRLTAPLSYNYLGMIHLDQAITNKTDRQETIFTSIMGHLNTISIISVGFNFYFPMLICLLSIGTFFRIGSRCLHFCGFRQFFHDDDFAAEFVEDGKSLMTIERRNYGSSSTLSNTTTPNQRRDRRREFEQKYGSLRSSRSSSTNDRRFIDRSFTDAAPLNLAIGDDEPLLSGENTQNRHQSNNKLLTNYSQSSDERMA